MTTFLKAIRFKNLDEAQQVLSGFVSPQEVAQALGDEGREPQGLLSAVTEDRLPEEVFCRLLDERKGLLIEVEKIGYSGYGPPAQEQDYMGFVKRRTAYVLRGRRWKIEIRKCPQGARDIHHLEALVLDRQHPLNRPDLARRLDLSEDWDFEDLFGLIAARQYSAQELDRLIHRGIQ
ncbi:MAG: hypothetical protein V3T83_16720 [Acidobacteriota bacterium]